MPDAGASRGRSSRMATMTITQDALRPLKALVKRHVSRASIDRALLAFPQLYPALRYESQLSPAQLEILQSLLLRGLPGNIIECGVYRAGTTVLLARMLSQHQLTKRIYALDSFSGFAPEIEDEIRQGLVVKEGRTAFRANSVEYVRRKLGGAGRSGSHRGRTRILRGHPADDRRSLLPGPGRLRPREEHRVLLGATLDEADRRRLHRGR